MEIRDVSIVWEKGISGYRQGIKGRKNYRHKEAGKFYNGYGGVFESIPRELYLLGKESSGKEVRIDMFLIMQAIGRDRMTERLYENLEKCLPESINVEEGHISEKDLQKIIANYNKIKK